LVTVFRIAKKPTKCLSDAIVNAWAERDFAFVETKEISKALHSAEFAHRSAASRAGDAVIEHSSGQVPWMRDAAGRPNDALANDALVRWPLRGRFTAQSDRLRTALTRRPFLRNVSIMLTGSAAGQLVSVLLSPVLTRIFSPQQFGVLSIYTALLTILVVIASLRYELALTLAASEEEAINLVAVCICALLATTFMVGAASLAFPEEWVKILWTNPYESYRQNGYRGLFILGFFCLGGYYVALYFATRAEAFAAIARTRIYQGVTGPLSQIALGLGGFGAPGLLIGSILGQSAGTFGLFYGQIGRNRALLRAISWSRMMALARRYSRFPLVASWAALIDAAGGNQLLYLVVSVQYSPAIAGFIFLAERIVARPLSLIGTSILQVFVGEAGKMVSADPAKLRARFYQVVTRQFGLALAWIMLANVAGATFFPTVFGSDWGDAVIYLQAMSLAYLAQAIVLPVFHTLQILERQTMAAMWQLSRLALVIVTFFLSTTFDLSAPTTIFCYSASQAVSCTILLALMAKSIQRLQR
jgi:O-antigen/teichoic acid export membrane protein